MRCSKLLSAGVALAVLAASTALDATARVRRGPPAAGLGPALGPAPASRTGTVACPAAPVSVRDARPPDRSDRPVQYNGWDVRAQATASMFGVATFLRAKGAFGGDRISCDYVGAFGVAIELTRTLPAGSCQPGPGWTVERDNGVETTWSTRELDKAQLTCQ